jgi:hypothetical protein
MVVELIGALPLTVHLLYHWVCRCEALQSTSVLPKLFLPCGFRIKPQAGWWFLLATRPLRTMGVLPATIIPCLISLEEAWVEWRIATKTASCR